MMSCGSEPVGGDYANTDTTNAPIVTPNSSTPTTKSAVFENVSPCIVLTPFISVRRGSTLDSYPDSYDETMTQRSGLSVQTRNPSLSGSSSSITNACSPVIQAAPSISGTIAG